MSKRATNKEQEIRVNHAVNFAAEGESFSSLSAQVAEKYSISRRQARRITSAA